MTEGLDERSHEPVRSVGYRLSGKLLKTGGFVNKAFDLMLGGAYTCKLEINMAQAVKVILPGLDSGHTFA